MLEIVSCSTKRSYQRPWGAGVQECHLAHTRIASQDLLRTEKLVHTLETLLYKHLIMNPIMRIDD
jgi:hypothetical protein